MPISSSIKNNKKKSTNKFNTFAYVFRKSLTSVKYYKDVIKAPLSFSIKYLCMLAVIATVIVALTASIVYIPKMNKFSKELITNIATVYPDDLVFKMENNEWSVNRPEPFIIPLPEFAQEKDMPTNMAVFYKAGTVEDIERFNTLILINKVNMLTRGDRKIEVYPIKDIPNGQFTKTEYIKVIGVVEHMLSYVPYAIVVCSVIALFIYYFGIKLIGLLVVTVFLWVISKIVNSKLSFGKIYRISIHTLTVPLLLEVISKVAAISSNGSFMIGGGWLFLLQLIIGTVVIARISAK